MRIILTSTFFSFLFLMVSISYGQKPKDCVMKGNAPFAVGEEIRVLLIDDLISLNKEVVAKTTIDAEGNFELTFPTTTIQLAEVRIKTSVGEMFVVPGRNYELDISMDSALFQTLTPDAFGAYLQIKNIELDTNDLNYKINEFNNYYQQLVDFYNYEIFNERNSNYLDTVRHYITERFPLQNNPTNYYHTYIYYSYGMLELFFYKSSQKMYEKYLNSEYIHYDNPAYMSFFNMFYDNYLYYSSTIPKQLLEDAINEDVDYLQLFNAVGEDPLLVNERLRELVIIKNLSELMNSKYYVRGNVIAMLQHLKNDTHFSQHPKIIDGILAKPAPNVKGAPIDLPQWVMPSENKFKSKKLKGNPTYFYFFNYDCFDCIRAFLILEEIYKQYQDSLNVVAVSLDFNFETYQNKTETYAQFSFPILHFNQCYDWINEMQIGTIPDYFLVDEEMKMIERYLPPPDQGLIFRFMKMFKPEEIEPENPMFSKPYRH